MFRGSGFQPRFFHFCTDYNHGELPYAHGSLRCALLRIRQLAVIAVSVLHPPKS
ncbi:MAG: hypothetical protein ACI88G_001553, partial [Woeseiaceae bacterium]